MTGEQHYREAEVILARTGGASERDRADIARAQVHATLALAAAALVQHHTRTESR
jgi:hypothetical protein